MTGGHEGAAIVMTTGTGGAAGETETTIGSIITVADTPPPLVLTLAHQRHLVVGHPRNHEHHLDQDHPAARVAITVAVALLITSVDAPDRHQMAVVMDRAHISVHLPVPLAGAPQSLHHAIAGTIDQGPNDSLT